MPDNTEKEGVRRQVKVEEDDDPQRKVVANMAVKRKNSYLHIVGRRGSEGLVEPSAPTEGWLNIRRRAVRCEIPS